MMGSRERAESVGTQPQRTRMYVSHVRVPYAHVDQMAIVYYANYYVYFEMARAEFLRAVNLPYADLESRGVMLPIVESHCNYFKPARFDDLIEIRSWCSHIKGTRLRVDYEVWRDQEKLVVGHTHHACIIGGRVSRLAPDLYRLFDE